jgi:predicted RNase H-like HicB family nuclease
MKLIVTLREGEDGWIVAECPQLPGCVSQGKTREEALANIREAIELVIEVRAERNESIFLDSEEIEVTV